MHRCRCHRIGSENVGKATTEAGSPTNWLAWRSSGVRDPPPDLVADLATRLRAVESDPEPGRSVITKVDLESTDTGDSIQQAAKVIGTKSVKRVLISGRLHYNSRNR
jgi:hypothetical protein